MHFRNPRVRAKVTALIVSLIALWAFASWVTLREGLNVLWVNTLDTGVAQPSERLRVELQRERRLTVTFLADPADTRLRTVMTTQRARTETAITDFREKTTSSEVRGAASDPLTRRINETIRQLQTLGPLRRQVDNGQVDRTRATLAITQVIDTLYRVYDSMATLDDTEFAKDTRTFIELGRANELLAQEDALAAGALAAGGLTGTDQSLFAQAVGAQRFFMAKAAAELPADEHAAWEKLWRGQAFTALRRMEDQLIRSGAPEVNSIDGERWQAVTSAVYSDVDRLIESGGDTLVERAAPIAIGVIVRLALAGGLGLLAVIASIVLSITTARALVRRLEELRAAALELAERRLPSVVERLGRGDEVNVAAEAPPLAVGNDAIGQVGQAFNLVQETAIHTAVEQAELRRGYRGILLSLARRTQSLVHRQLSILDAMEKRETEPAELADLFRVDHLATRMRRNAENLIVLSGASPGRAWRRAVPMVDVVRGALAEVEDYTQVTLMPMGEARLAGRAIGDVIHLLAELIENAVSFSPPYALVQVSGQEVAKGYVVEIEDRGLGMPSEELAAANERIADPPEFRLSGTPRLGLYVVSRLAARHHIKVTLKASAYGGTTVVVLIPRDLIESDSDAEPASGGPEVLPRRVSRGGPPEPRRSGLRSTGEVPVYADEPKEVDEAMEARPLLTVAPPWKETPAGQAGPLPAPVPSLTTGEPGAGASAPDITGERAGDAAGQESGDEHATAPAFTPSGLPRRVAQAHLAPALRDQPSTPPQAEAAEDDELSPEDLRRLMGSFQSGTERGRSDAAKLPRRPPRGDEPPVPSS
ncbi:ATPase [Sphaerisporangium melleum]|uniref:histidine kinase n=1 Tax=Sphaerisporangium melleum TaxID=321316 RepID=A0A917R578_9ACTN|nr:nitrate- and nitrite sensing domain-containing protein [Sphaerisporangium melleum]GGK88870.1 ATPase [Sphaerisporangium melleum]GII67737.1 ATPase [Sphaerisporangium melleum]